MTATLDEIRSSLGGRSPAYNAKMMHRVPDAPVVDRAAFILERCKGKVVLDIGASGPMHAAIVQVAAKCYGIDREYQPGVKEFDIDDTSNCDLPWPDEMTELVVCGEVIEHLSNPGHLLKLLRRGNRIPVIITVPNAFCELGIKHLFRGFENVNIDHVAWYSPRTLKTLLERVGYQITEMYGYNGRWPVCEGIIVVAE